ncbi:MAG TPA: hypothetical protein PKL15_16405, partial [Saprospiraceae bacterium]|nr:hypothetical protein [Saprospiraceae bacterium]
KYNGATQFSLGYVGERRGLNPSAGIITSRYSYSYAGDMNGDGISNNDLLYVPNSASDLTFDLLEIKNSQGTVIASFTPEQQRDAYEAFIQQDEYLNSNRGKYLERNGALFPMLHRLDLSVMQEFGVKVGEKHNTIQFRVDIINFGNLINNDWGVGDVLVTDRPLSFSKVSADGLPSYKMATTTINGQPSLIKSTYVKGASAFDVWNAQFSIRYTFN